MRAKFVNEKFSEESDSIQDMGIGGYSYETLKPGAIIVPREYMRFGKNTGTLVSKGGSAVYPRYPLMIIDVKTSYEVKGEGNDRYFSCLAYANEADARKHREKLKNGDEGLKSLLSRSWHAQIKINIKKQAFNNRFQIIERGF